MKLSEDDLYRRSTQYKHWSFTPAKLALLRQKTNIQASERVKANVARQRAERAKKLDVASLSESDLGNTSGAETGSGVNTPVPLDQEVQCLTVVEEMKVVDKFCDLALELGKFIGVPADITVRILFKSSPVRR
jgi:cyclin H